MTWPALFSTTCGEEEGGREGGGREGGWGKHVSELFMKREDGDFRLEGGGREGGRAYLNVRPRFKVHRAQSITGL